MKTSNLFYEYYDILYQNKDYKKEVDHIFSLVKRLGNRKPKKMLEIGCGTGNHTLLLAKKVNKLVAIDIDPEMVVRAKDKIKKASVPNAQILQSPVEKLGKQKFDIAVGLFNVITYISTYIELIRFMRSVSLHLSSSGLFIFDCWNGIAAIQDPPHINTKNVKYDGKTILCQVIPQNDFLHQITKLRYTIIVDDGKIKKKDSYILKQSLFTPMQIEFAVAQANMKILSCSPLISDKINATAKDWKLLYVAQKNK